MMKMQILTHDTIDELKSYDLFNTFFGDEYAKFLDSLQDYADKTYEESYKDDVKEPEKPSTKFPLYTSPFENLYSPCPFFFPLLISPWYESPFEN